MPLLTLDRLLQGRAILVDEQGNQWELPSAALPPGAGEGDLLDVKLKKRKGSGQKLQQQIEQLQEKLKKLQKKEE